MRNLDFTNVLESNSECVDISHRSDLTPLCALKPMHQKNAVNPEKMGNLQALE
jgi:hypothetical protein